MLDIDNQYARRAYCRSIISKNDIVLIDKRVVGHRLPPWRRLEPVPFDLTGEA
jgi:hypothetical protein